MMMSNIQRLKANAIQNGQLINADDLNAEFDQLINKANEVDDAIYQNKTLTGNKVFNGITTFQQNVTMNGELIIDGAPMPQRHQVHWAGDETGITGNVFQVDPDYVPNPLPDGYTVSFNVVGTPVETSPISIGVGSNAPLPITSTGGVMLHGTDVTDGQCLTIKKIGGGFQLVGTSRLPRKYMNTPIPDYIGTSTIRMIGWASMRSANGQHDIEFYLGVVNISTATTGLNGLASGVVSGNTWYYLKGVKSLDGTQAGYVIDTDLNEPNLTMNGVEYVVRRLPIAFRTLTNGGLIPFTVTGGWPYQPRVDYTTGFTGYLQSGAPLSTEVDSRVLIAGTAATNTLVTCGALVPPTARVAHLCITGEGAQGTLFLTTPHDAALNRGQSFWNNPSLEANHNEATVLTDGSRQFKYRTLGGTWFATVRGFTTTLI